jgi:hypothetical protein
MIVIESIESVMAEQNAKFDALFRTSRDQVLNLEPPVRDPHYNTANDPYRRIGALPEISFIPSTSFFGGTFGYF